MKTPFLLRTDGTTEPLAYTSPQTLMNGQEEQSSLTTLQAAVGSYIEGIAVPEDASLILLINEDGSRLKLPPNFQASAVAQCPSVGDAVLLPRGLLC